MTRSQRQKRREKYVKPSIKKKETVIATKKQGFYDANYKKLIIIPMALLLIAIILISMKVINTGEFMNRGITLSGGISITVLTENIDKDVLLSDLQQEFPDYQMNLRGIDEAGRRIGVLIETNMPPENTEEVNRFNEIIKERTNATEDDISTETMGSSLGAAFFQQTMLALILAFIFMGIVIFLYFKMVVPSALTILSALSDIIITLAIVNVLGLNIGTAGIAAFLMLIGYSVDANIVLNMRVLKRTSGTVKSQIKSAFSTGLTMSVTTLTAIIVAFFIVDSPVLREIMIIMIIGLIVDVLNTWVQNAGLLRWYLERKETKN